MNHGHPRNNGGSPTSNNQGGNNHGANNGGTNRGGNNHASPHPARLDSQVRRHRLQRQNGLPPGERSIGQNLALIGALGWTIVVPTVFGVFAGSWLDQNYPGPSRLFWTMGLLISGLALGCHLAWKRIHRE